jgi:ribosomal protein S27AE
MYSIFWELRQLRMIGEAEAAAERAASAKVTTDTRLRELENRLDKLMLVCLAMWELLMEKGGLSEEELAEKVEEIDLRDGVGDGKITRKVAECPQCGRVMSPRHSRCLYCGAEKLNVTAFDKLL